MSGAPCPPGALWRSPWWRQKYEAKSPLREALDILSAENIEDLTLDELTVLSPQNDPYRLDTPDHHRNGQWLRLQMEACGLIRPDGYFASQIHNRGIHYAIFSNGAIRPDGEKFKNDDKGWEFLEKASKAARWLGYVPFEAIFDARNSPPVIRLKEERSKLPPYSHASVTIRRLNIKLRCQEPI